MLQAEGIRFQMFFVSPPGHEASTVWYGIALVDRRNILNILPICTTRYHDD